MRAGRSKGELPVTAELFTAEDHITSTIAGYEARMDVVRERYQSYHADVQRRYVSDEWHQVRNRIVGAQRFLAGEYDGTYPGDSSHVSFGGLHPWRAHYADDALRTALHHLIWAEHYAGLRDREATRELDPWNH
jgi:hypothetical protein